MKFLDPLYDKTLVVWQGLVEMIPLIAIGILTILITWIVSIIASKLFIKTLSKSHIRKSLKVLFNTLLKAAIWTIGILISVTIIFPSLTPAKLLATIGLGSVAIGFAFKDIFENFFAGILIMLRESMRIGDFIECESISGKVEQISLRETYLRKTDDQLVILPNSFLFKNPVSILTDKDLRRFDVVVGVGYDEDVDNARSVIEAALKTLEGIRQDKPIEVYAREFNSSSIDFIVRWWSESTPLSKHKSKDKVVTSIKSALDNAGIEIPYPYRTMTFKEQLKIEQA